MLISNASNKQGRAKNMINKKGRAKKDMMLINVAKRRLIIEAWTTRILAQRRGKSWEYLYLGNRR